MRVAQHRRFDQGIIQDEHSLLVPDGAVYSSKNMLYDKIGVARKRGGITGVGATTNYFNDHIGTLIADDGTQTLYGIGKDSIPLKYINASTGAMTDISIPVATGDLNPNGGRPFQHHGFLMFPAYTTALSPVGTGPLSASGATGAIGARTFTTPATVVLTAGDKRVPCAAADDPTTLMQVGQLVIVVASPLYVGRVTRLVSTTAFEVYPTPTVTTAGATNVLTYNGSSPGASSLSNSYAYLGGKVGMSFQGRVCLGSCTRLDPATGNRGEVFPRRFAFSSTLLEGDTQSPAKYQGAVWITRNAYPPYNYFDIPVQEEITAMSPTGFGDALIFSAYRTFRLTGNLSTQYGTSQSITWAVREIPNSVGCMSERSLQRTPRGVIFAHDSGIYTTDGNSMNPLLHGRVANAWKGLVKGSGVAGNFVIYGSALIRGNHYYICGVSNGAFWGWLCNLDTLAWSFLSGKATAAASWIVNSAVTDSLNPAITRALKWWDQSGTGPSMTGGQLVDLASMFTPTSATRSDNDGTLVNFEIVTKPYDEGSPGMQKTWYDATILYDSQGAPNITVRPAFVSNSADAPAGGPTTFLPEQNLYTVTAGTNASPIVLTIGAGHNIKQGGFVRVKGVTGLTNANGLWRVDAVTGTTVTLQGSIGNAAYVSGGQVQCTDQRDLSLLQSLQAESTADPAAVAYRINDTDSGGAGGADLFELIGIQHTWEERDTGAE